MIIIYFLILCVAASVLMLTYHNRRIKNTSENFKDTSTVNKNTYSKVIIYAYCEVSDTHVENLNFFLENSYDEMVLFIIVVNGEKCSANIPTVDNIITLKRENTGFDFGGYYEGILHVLKNNINPEYLFFLNGSCRGPFLPTYYKEYFMDIFINIAIEDNVSMVGSTINIHHSSDTLRPHCQTYAFLCKMDLIRSLIKDNFFDFTGINIKHDVITKFEIGLGKYVIDKNFGMSCLVPEYRIDYKNSSNVKINPHAVNTEGDIAFDGENRCYGRNIHPYEVVFIKTNRNFDQSLIQSLSQINRYSKTLDQVLKKITINKKGVEIGGPSQSGNTIYESADIIDNVIFSKNTVWHNSTNEYNFHKDKVGKVIINDATNIKNIKKETYDFCFASHCLEHIANPIKAVKEWLRITKKGGYIILILPNKKKCFDHKREYAQFATLLKQYINNVGEDDLSTLPDIIKNHDLELDPPAGNLDSFVNRSLNNYENRCLHHYVYNVDLLIKICNYVDCNYIYSIVQGLDIWFVMRKK